MEKCLIKYIIAIIVLSILYNLIPKEKIPINNIYLFIGLGLLILFIFDKMITPIYKKKNKRNNYESYSDTNSETSNSESSNSETSNSESSKSESSNSESSKSESSNSESSKSEFNNSESSKSDFSKSDFSNLESSNSESSNSESIKKEYITENFKNIKNKKTTENFKNIKDKTSENFRNTTYYKINTPLVDDIKKTASLTPIGTVSFLTPIAAPSSAPAPAPNTILNNQAMLLTADQIKNLNANDRDQLVQAYLLDLYKKTTPVINNPYILTEGEIVYYVSLFISNSHNKVKMNEIQKNILDIQKIDNNRGTILLKLMNLAQINPDLSLKIVGTSPLKLIEIVNSMNTSIDTNLIKESSNKSVELDLIKVLQGKISNIEKVVKVDSNKDSISDALMEIIGKNKYVDSKGMIQDLTYGDLKYNTQLSAGQMQALGSYDTTLNNKWDNTYTLLNTDKWRPADRKVPICKQEKVCPVCPTLTSGYPLSVMDYDKARHVMGPDGISVDYIKQQLNNPIKP